MIVQLYLRLILRLGWGELKYLPDFIDFFIYNKYLSFYFYYNQTVCKLSNRRQSTNTSYSLTGIC